MIVSGGQETSRNGQLPGISAFRVAEIVEHGVRNTPREPYVAILKSRAHRSYWGPHDRIASGEPSPVHLGSECCSPSSSLLILVFARGRWRMPLATNFESKLRSRAVESRRRSGRNEREKRISVSPSERPRRGKGLPAGRPRHSPRSGTYSATRLWSRFVLGIDHHRPDRTVVRPYRYLGVIPGRARIGTTGYSYDKCACFV